MFRGPSVIYSEVLCFFGHFIPKFSRLFSKKQALKCFFLRLVIRGTRHFIRELFKNYSMVAQIPSPVFKRGHRLSYLSPPCTSCKTFLLKCTALVFAIRDSVFFNGHSYLKRITACLTTSMLQRPMTGFKPSTLPICPKINGAPFYVVVSIPLCSLIFPGRIFYSCRFRPFGTSTLKHWLNARNMRVLFLCPMTPGFPIFWWKSFNLITYYFVVKSYSDF